jgi:hypothetical protein
MAANFIPNLLADMIFQANRKRTVFASLTNGDVAQTSTILQAGDRVKVSQFADVTVNTYTKGQDITWESLDDASQELVIDHLKYFAVRFDEVDLKQMAIDPMAAIADNASYKTADALDQYIAALYSSAGVKTGLGTTASPISISSSNIKTYLNLIGQRLSEANAPTDGRWLVCPPSMAHLISDLVASVATNMPAEGVVNNGRVARAYGFDIYESNNVATSSTKYFVMAGTKRAISLVQQINSVQETSLLPTKIGRGLVGLHVAGAKVIRPYDLACLTCTIS